MNGEVETGDFVIVLFQFAALALPALAILMQVILDYSEQRRFSLFGRKRRIQIQLFFIVAVTSFLLSISVFIIIHSLELSDGLFVAAYFLAAALLLFTLVPATITIYEFVNRNSKANKTFDAIELLEFEKSYDVEDENFKYALRETGLIDDVIEKVDESQRDTQKIDEEENRKRSDDDIERGAG